MSAKRDTIAAFICAVIDLDAMDHEDTEGDVFGELFWSLVQAGKYPDTHAEVAAWVDAKIAEDLAQRAEVMVDDPVNPSGAPRINGPRGEA